MLIIPLQLECTGRALKGISQCLISVHVYLESIREAEGRSPVAVRLTGIGDTMQDREKQEGRCEVYGPDRAGAPNRDEQGPRLKCIQRLLGW